MSGTSDKMRKDATTVGSMDPADARCGRIAVVGRSNAGKSTLINALLGRKLHIVTPRAQTTRTTTASALTLDSTQLILVDTPGLHRSNQLKNRMMNRSALAEIEGADLIVAVFDRTSHGRDDGHLLSRCREHGRALAVLNKVDLLRDKSLLLPRIAQLAATDAFVHIVPVSAATGDNLDRLFALLVELLPVAEHQMPAGQISDKPDSFFVVETLREQLLLRYRQEVPYSLQIELEDFVRKDGHMQVRILLRAIRPSQKAILLGAGGHRLEQLQEGTRLVLEERFGLRVSLNLHVTTGAGSIGRVD